jgi:hypothetical protein
MKSIAVAWRRLRRRPLESALAVAVVAASLGFAGAARAVLHGSLPHPLAVVVLATPCAGLV